VSTETVNPFLTWAPPGKSLVVQIDHEAMDRMNIEIMRGFGVTRRRGTETGGVLLGKIDRRSASPTVFVRDFEVVPCEYASGPSYVLSAADQQRFKETVEKWQPSLDRDIYAVGYFRSHTRDGFALDERDTAVVREFFPDPLDIALLVKPFATRPAIAGFFLKEKGVLVSSSTPLEFKFETPGRGIPPAAAEPVREASPAKPPAVPAAARAKATAPDLRTEIAEPAFQRDLFSAHVQPPSPWTRRLSWAAFCLALLAFGAACGFEYAGRALQKQKPQVNLSVPGGLPNSEMYAVQLQVVQAGSSVMVKWDRDAAPIQAALNGVLTVIEGANSKEVKLGFAELRNGTAMYPLVAPEITFRLEIFFKGNRSFVESAVYRRNATR
jgi:hypothetical protein